MLSSRYLLAGVFLGVLSLTVILADRAVAANSCPPQEITLGEDYEPYCESFWDPIEPVNRGFFWFNDEFYRHALKPVARGYRVAVPEPGRKAIGNVFTNLGAPVRIANNALQGKVVNTLDELAIFLANSTFGVGGLFDLHSETVKPTAEDFGQTLGYYGIPSGPYLVLPFIGSLNLRDGVGMVADNFVEPVSSPFYLKMHQYELLAVVAEEKINALSLDKDTYEAITRESLDPYATIRDAYMQNRAAKIAK
jgi:phospholipid-binding lipoprotein MlaA